MTLRRRGMIRNILKWTGLILIGIIIGGGSGFGYHFWMKAKQDNIPPVIRREVLTVNRDIALGERINEEDIAVMQVEENTLPADAFTEAGEIIGKKAWVDLTPKVVLRQAFFYQTRPDFMENEQEIVVQKLPDNLEIGDYIDLRIQFPSGHDYCVLAHKQVNNLWQEKNMIALGLSEEERVRMGSAQTDAATYEKAYLYLTIYPEAVDMPNTPVRYPVSGSVQELYEEVAGGNIIGQERKRLEAALVKLKSEEKFLETKEKEAAPEKAPSTETAGTETHPEDKNLQSHSPTPSAGKPATESGKTEEQSQKTEEAANPETASPAQGGETNY